MNFLARLSRPCLCAVLVFLFAAPLVLLPNSGQAADGTLPSNVLAMFPKDMGSFAYANLEESRKDPVFSAIFDQFLPQHFQQFKAFLGSGVNFDSQVREVAWGTMGKDASEQVVGVALGDFNSSDMDSKLQAMQVPMLPYDGYHLYAFGTGDGPGDLLFVFLDSNVAAFGNRAALERLISVRMGGEDSLLSNEVLSSMIDEANGDGLLWAVFDQARAKRAIDQLAPQAMAFPQAAAVLGRMQSLAFHVSGDDGAATIRLEAKCGSVDDANVLALALQTEVLYREYVSGHADSPFDGLLSRMTVTPSGDSLEVLLPLGSDDLQALIQMELSMARP